MSLADVCIQLSVIQIFIERKKSISFPLSPCLNSTLSLLYTLIHETLYNMENTPISNTVIQPETQSRLHLLAFWFSSAQVEVVGRGLTRPHGLLGSAIRGT